MAERGIDIRHETVRFWWTDLAQCSLRRSVSDDSRKCPAIRSGAIVTFANITTFLGNFCPTCKLLILLVWADGRVARLTSKKRGRDNAAPDMPPPDITLPLSGVMDLSPDVGKMFHPRMFRRASIIPMTPRLIAPLSLPPRFSPPLPRPPRRPQRRSISSSS